MKTAYFVILVKDENDGMFYDEFGSYDKKEAKSELQWIKDDGKRARMVKTDGTTESLIAAIETANK